MILLLFVSGFYASVEQADHPELRGRAVLVGGNPRKRGTVTSTSAEAAALGIRMYTIEPQGLQQIPGTLGAALRGVAVLGGIAVLPRGIGALRDRTQGVIQTLEKDGAVRTEDLSQPQRTLEMAAAHRCPGRGHQDREA